MNKKLLVLVGVTLLSAAAIFLSLNKNRSSTNDNQNSLNYLNEEVVVGNDICAEFPKEWVSTVLGKSIIKTDTLDSSGTYVCQYYVNESSFVTLRLNNLNVENQKKGQTSLGRTISTNPNIQMEHFVVLQEDGLINGIYLVINPNLFIAVDRTSTKAATDDEIINFASKVAERIQSGENYTITPTSNTVPSFNGEDLVNNFFTLIDEGKIEDAVGMMAPSVIPSDSDKQAWGVQFNAFKNISVKKVEPSGENTYKVTLDVEMKPESENAPIPFYGYDNGENIRWISLEDVNGLWMIAGIATGP